MSSYSVPSCVRHDISTTILMQLCVSLICLTLLIFVVSAVRLSPLWCRWINVFRIYLVLVSLMWNAMETHNMWYNLASTSNRPIRQFIWRATCVAWGKVDLGPRLPSKINVKIHVQGYPNITAPPPPPPPPPPHIVPPPPHPFTTPNPHPRLTPKRMFELLTGGD